MNLKSFWSARLAGNRPGLKWHLVESEFSTGFICRKRPVRETAIHYRRLRATNRFLLQKDFCELCLERIK